MPPPAAKPASAPPETAYKSPEELERLARDGALTPEELRAQIQLGFDSLDRGEGVVFNTAEELRAYIADVGRRAREEARRR